MGKRLTTRFLDQRDRFCDFRAAASAAYHSSAGLCISDCNAATDATTGAGDDGDFTRERMGI
ncbi:hypothetical protein D3C81_2336800 [compost metagenome]